jgi:hypothetical protein
VPKKATAQDAQLLVQLCRVRSEEEMRQAHLWWRKRFWPKNVADYLKVETALGARENIWLQQVVSYWGMAASFVLEGTLSEKVFLDPAFSGEMFAVFSKVQPFLKDLRERLQKPELLLNIEKVIMSSSKGRARLRRMAKRQPASRRTAVRPVKETR